MKYLAWYRMPENSESKRKVMVKGRMRLRLRLKWLDKTYEAYQCVCVCAPVCVSCSL